VTATGLQMAVRARCRGGPAPYFTAMNRALRVAAIVGLAIAAVGSVPAARAESDAAAQTGHPSVMSKKAAIKVMQDAGYSGIGGATFNDPFYFSAAISPDGKRVRLTVDSRSGDLVKVGPLARGSGSVNPGLASPGLAAEYVPPRIDAPGPAQPLTPYYHPPAPPRAIGVTNYPFTAGGLAPARAWCRYRANAPGC
jgi:hypothetical protein